MSRTLVGKRVLLTGASSGIGRALAEELADAGARVVAAARSADKLDELARAHWSVEPKIIPLSVDLLKAEDREWLVNTAVEKLGGLDLLINNAGIASWGHFANSDEATLRQVMELNFFVPVDLIRSAIPHLTDGNEPAIVNISSMCGRRGMPAWPEYSASKFALSGLSESLRGEMARFGIDVMLIVPGLTKTNLREHMAHNEGKAKIDFDKGMDPAYVASRITRAIASNKREVVIGSDAKWMLRMHRWFPRLLDYLIRRKVKKLYA